MQVFVPFPCIYSSTACLDESRLGNQIYREALTLVKGGWPNHPVSKMWRFHTYFLCEYAFAGLEELQRRGHYYPHIYDQFARIQKRVPDTGPPCWWGDSRVHNSHKANLLRKDRHFYSCYNWERDGIVPSEVYYYPQIELVAEAQRLQPIIREFYNKGVDA